MILQKWNYEEHKYKPYRTPKNWICKTYSNDMDEIVHCPHCGKTTKFRRLLHIIRNTYRNWNGICCM